MSLSSLEFSEMWKYFLNILKKTGISSRRAARKNTFNTRLHVILFECIKLFYLIIRNTIGIEANATKIGTDDVNNVAGLYCVIGEEITTYSSAESRIVNHGTNTFIVIWLNSKTLQEKPQWLYKLFFKK